MEAGMQAGRWIGVEAWKQECRQVGDLKVTLSRDGRRGCLRVKRNIGQNVL